MGSIVLYVALCCCFYDVKRQGITIIKTKARRTILILYTCLAVHLHRATTTCTVGGSGIATDNRDQELFSGITVII